MFEMGFRNPSKSIPNLTLKPTQLIYPNPHVAGVPTVPEERLPTLYEGKVFTPNSTAI